MALNTHTPYLPTDSVWTTDTVAVDTIPVGERLTPVVLAHREEGIRAAVVEDGQSGTSWILVGVLVVVCIVFARYNSNIKYIKTMLHDLTNVRERGNVFDDTAKETSFMFMLNVLCAVSTGLMVYVSICAGGMFPSDADISLEAFRCMLCTGGYCLLMPAVYWCVGQVFSDTLHTRLWLRGFLSSQAILGILMLVPSLTALFYPQAGNALTITALCILVALKIVFITKTFRIFFTQFSSWVLFLYYLCTLEILPLVLTYSTAERFAG